METSSPSSSRVMLVNGTDIEQTTSGERPTYILEKNTLIDDFVNRPSSTSCRLNYPFYKALSQSIEIAMIIRIVSDCS